MAAIKRSQANQRRHPDTFHFYQQQMSSSSSSASSSSFSGVKVELQQLVLAILDDPVVSRVFGEAGFRSCDIKMAILRPPPPPILRFPRSARCPPLFLCNLPSWDGVGNDNCRRIGEIMLRKCNRNPMLVGVGAADAVKDFKNWRNNLPAELGTLKFVDFELEESLDCCWIRRRVEELKEGTGVVVGVGDLKGLMELREELVDCLVEEVTKMLEVCNGRLWVMGWSATYETYMKFVSRYQTLDKDWDLQLQLITSPAKSPMGGLVVSRPMSLMESFVPFGGFFPTTCESSVRVMKPYSSVSRCHLCNDKYDEELATLLKECTPCEDQRPTKLPSWLQSVDLVKLNNQLDASKVKDEKVLNAQVVELQKKWNEHCQRLHQGSPKPEPSKDHVLPPLIGLPCVLNKDRSTNPNILNPGESSHSKFNPGETQNLCVGNNALFATTVGHSIISPLVSEPINKDLISKLQVGIPRSEQLQTEGMRSHQNALSDMSTSDDRPSPSSVTSVTTNLVLGTLCESSFTELALCSPSTKHNEFRVHQILQPPKASSSSSNTSPKFDLSNLKTFYASFLEKVGRQDAAIRAISQTIIRCKDHERCRGSSFKGDIWLSFLGPDRFGKKRTASTLAELMFGSRENMIWVDLCYPDNMTNRNSICDQHELSKYDVSLRGKTVTDYLAEAICRKPSSVVVIDNVEKADFLVQDRLSQAIRTGKIADSYGREYGINNAIFVVATSKVWGRTLSPRKETASFSEEKILAAQRWQLKISVESISVTMKRRSNFNVSIAWRQESASKRKLDISDCHKDQQEFPETPKRAHKIPNATLDLNLPVEDEMADNDGECSSSSNSSGGEDSWIEEILKSTDENVSFEPFDFNSLANYVMKEMSKRLRDTMGSKRLMEIDAMAMEEILAATWLLEDIGHLDSWLENVLVRSFIELRRRYSNKLSTGAVVKLVACEETCTEYAPGVLLPSRIILD